MGNKLENHLQDHPGVIAEIQKMIRLENETERLRPIVKTILDEDVSKKLTVGEISDLPEYIKSLDYLTLPEGNKLNNKTLAEVNKKIGSLVEKQSSDISKKLVPIKDALSKLDHSLRGLNIPKDVSQDIRNIISRLNSEKINLEEFEEQLLGKLIEKVKGSTKVVQVHSGGGLAALPLNRIPGVNISDPQNNDILIYDSDTQTWINGNSGSIGGERFEIRTEDITLNHLNANTIYNNKGASGITTFTVATDSHAGDSWELEVGQDTNGIKVLAEGARTIRMSGAESVAGGYIQSLLKGAIAKVIVVDEDEIFVRYSTRSWGIV